MMKFLVIVTVVAAVFASPVEVADGGKLNCCHQNPQTLECSGNGCNDLCCGCQGVCTGPKLGCDWIE